MDQVDYRKFYDKSEPYLLDEVGPHFRDTGKLEPADFYALLIWKAERAKTRHKKRLARTAGSFAGAVQQIGSDLYKSTSDKDRLQVLIEKWWFRLPTASAILTVLYPESFTVYDWRVCDELGCDYEPWSWRDFSDALWNHYQSFKQAVVNGTPSDLPCLRERDKFLLGRSTRKSIVRDSGS